MKDDAVAVYYRLFIFSIKYFWALDNITPEEYVKKYLKKPEISNLRGTAFGVRLTVKKSNLTFGPIIREQHKSYR